MEREPEDGLYEEGYENIIILWPRRPNVCEIWSKGSIRMTEIMWVGNKEGSQLSGWKKIC